jgi:hypothetical protein
MRSQRFAKPSQAALSLGLREFSDMRSHSSALNRYSSGLVILLGLSHSLRSARLTRSVFSASVRLPLGHSALFLPREHDPEPA